MTPDSDLEARVNAHVAEERDRVVVPADLHRRIMHRVEQTAGARASSWRMQLAAALGILLLGLGVAAIIARSRSTPSVTPTPATSPSAAPTPTPTAPTPSPSAAAVMCRLPIDRIPAGGAGAFLDIPVWTSDQDVLGRTPTSPPEDPESQVKLPNGDPPAALAYDWSLKRWLPVRPEWVSPDGSQYAYTDSQSRIHVVKVTSGADRVIASGANWAVINFSSEGIYAAIRDPQKQPSINGLSLIAVDSGKIRRIADSAPWELVDKGAAWAAVNPGFPTQSAGGLPDKGYGNTLQRLDLQTGTVTTWYTASGPFLLLAVDPTGHPIMARDRAGSVIWKVTVPGAVETVGSGFVAGALSDAHGTWFIESMTISVFLIDGNRTRAMARYGSGGIVRIAGACR